jgi:hypothetical protein
MESEPFAGGVTRGSNYLIIFNYVSRTGPGERVR